MKKDSRVRLFEVMRRVVPEFNNEGVNFNVLHGKPLYRPEDYIKKAKEIKAEIDKLFNEEEFEDLDTIYRLLIRRTKSPMSPEELKEIFDKFNKYGNK